jgi:hypothetical protein
MIHSEVMHVLRAMIKVIARDNQKASLTRRAKECGGAVLIFFGILVGDSAVGMLTGIVALGVWSIMLPWGFLALINTLLFGLAVLIPLGLILAQGRLVTWISAKAHVKLPWSKTSGIIASVVSVIVLILSVFLGGWVVFFHLRSGAWPSLSEASRLFTQSLFSPENFFAYPFDTYSLGVYFLAIQVPVSSVHTLLFYDFLTKSRNPGALECC